MFFPFTFKYSRKYQFSTLDRSTLLKYVYDRIYHLGQVDKIAVENDKIIFKTQWYRNIGCFNPHIFSGLDEGIINIFEKSSEINFEFITWRFPTLLILIALIFSFATNIWWLGLILFISILSLDSIISFIRLNKFVNKIVNEINELPNKN